MDAFLINWFDRGATWLQRKGWLLTRMQWYMASLALAAGLAGDILTHKGPGWYAFTFVCFGPQAVGYFYHCKNHDEYPFIVRMAEMLNIVSSRVRFSSVMVRVRTIWLFSFGGFLVGDIVGFIYGANMLKPLTSDIALACFTIRSYLDCST